jgi:hypothetical protein
MTRTKTTRIFLFASVIVLAGATQLTGHSVKSIATAGLNLLIPTAEARIGRPLTPISYAGVARRTTRRAIYRTSVYVAALPVGCTTVVITGTTLHQCGTTYYQASGGQYVVVNVD